MKKVIVAPDSFKGTLSSKKASETISRAIRDVLPDAEVVSFCIADGGEGTAESLGAERIPVTVTGPNFRPVSSFYGVLGDRAVIELAAAAGLTLADPADPLATTTYGVGELILHALDSGFRKLTVAIGGSATNDCGCGMAAACGVRFSDKNGDTFIPVGSTLGLIHRIDLSEIDKRIRETEITVLCDVKNPLFGEEGAAYVFAPQKGADERGVRLLDAGLRHIAGAIERDTGVSVADMEGAGAAGGCGAGLKAFFGAELRRGIDGILDAAGFEEKLDGADLVMTGEGRFDPQSAGGKAVSGIAARASSAGVPVAVICGSADPRARVPGVTYVFAVVNGDITKEMSISDPEKYLYLAARRAIEEIRKK